MDYSKGKIYKIVDKTNDDIYIGSTIQTLLRRYQTHQIFRDYDKKQKDCEIILIEDYPCESKRQLEQREQYYLDNTECINRSDAVMNIEKRRLASNNCNKKRREELRPYKNEWQNKRIRYEKTWGGDRRFHNNLLMIDPYLFLV